MVQKNRILINGLIVAAGLSKRMGQFKPLMPLQGKTVIENAINSMLESGVHQVVIVLGYRADEVEHCLRSRYQNEILLAYNPNYAATDMLESIKCGLRAMPVCSSFFLLPGDMPAVRKNTFQALVNARPDNRPAVLFPTINSYRKHPPLIDSSFIPAILNYQGSGGLRQIWTSLEDHILTVPVDDKGVSLDLDTMSDYQNCLTIL